MIKYLLIILFPIILMAENQNEKINILGKIRLGEEFDQVDFSWSIKNFKNEIFSLIFYLFSIGKKNIVILNMVHFGALLYFQNLRKKILSKNWSFLEMLTWFWTYFFIY